MDQQLLSSLNALVSAMHSLSNKITTPSRFEMIALSLIKIDAMAGGIARGGTSMESEENKTDRLKNHFQQILEDASFINECFSTYYQKKNKK